MSITRPYGAPGLLANWPGHQPDRPAQGRPGMAPHAPSGLALAPPFGLASAAPSGLAPAAPSGPSAPFGPRRRAVLSALLAAPLAAGALRRSPASAAPAVPPPQVNVLVLGDSLAAGYGLLASEGFQAVLRQEVEKRTSNVTFFDAAVSGDTTAGGRARLDWSLVAPMAVAIVELGGNDGLRGLPPQATRENLAAILDELLRRDTRVLLSGMYAPPNLGADYGRQFHAVFDELGRKPGVTYDPFFLEGVAGDPALNQPDRIHPNAEGVRRIVARLAPVVLGLVEASRQ